MALELEVISQLETDKWYDFYVVYEDRSVKPHYAKFNHALLFGSHRFIVIETECNQELVLQDKQVRGIFGPLRK